MEIPPVSNFTRNTYIYARCNVFTGTDFKKHVFSFHLLYYNVISITHSKTTELLINITNILQEVDHFEFLNKTLSTQGYQGLFFPKPDSPCLYVKDNNGPDGCAIFFRKSKFEMLKSKKLVLPVWTISSNQVCI